MYSQLGCIYHPEMRTQRHVAPNYTVRGVNVREITLGNTGRSRSCGQRALCGFYTMNSQGCEILTGLVPEELRTKKLPGEQIKFQGPSTEIDGGVLAGLTSEHSGSSKASQDHGPQTEVQPSARGAEIATGRVEPACPEELFVWRFCD